MACHLRYYCSRMIPIGHEAALGKAGSSAPRPYAPASSHYPGLEARPAFCLGAGLGD